LEDLKEECQVGELWNIYLLNLNIIRLVDNKTKPKIIVKGEPLYSIYHCEKGNLVEITKEELIVCLMRYILEF
jgi:hypothetical protein